MTAVCFCRSILFCDVRNSVFENDISDGKSAICKNNNGLFFAFFMNFLAIVPILLYFLKLMYQRNNCTFFYKNNYCKKRNMEMHMPIATIFVHNFKK